MQSASSSTFWPCPDFYLPIRVGLAWQDNYQRNLSEILKGRTFLILFLVSFSSASSEVVVHAVSDVSYSVHQTWVFLIAASLLTSILHLKDTVMVNCLRTGIPVQQKMFEFERWKKWPSWQFSLCFVTFQQLVIWSFPRVYGPEDSQEAVFEEVKSLLTSLLDGWVWKERKNLISKIHSL